MKKKYINYKKGILIMKIKNLFFINKFLLYIEEEMILFYNLND